MTKKILALVFAALMLLSVVSCGEDEPANEQYGAIFQNFSATGYTVYGYEHDGKLLNDFTDEQLKPEEVYKNLTYTPEMFYGDYAIFGKNAEDKYGETADYMKIDIGDTLYNITVCPYRIVAGKEDMDHRICEIEGYNWARFYYMRYYSNDSKEPNLDTILGAYTVEGTTISFTPITSYEYDEKTGVGTHTFADITLKYDFKFRGRQLTLSMDGESVDLYSGLSTYKEKIYIYADAYIASDSKKVENIDRINVSFHEDAARISLSSNDYSDKSMLGAKGAVGHFSESGVFTLTVPWEKETEAQRWETKVETYQFVYFLCGSSGLVLADGKDVYYYTKNRGEALREDINTFIPEDKEEVLESMPEEEMEDIVEKKDNLVADLVKAFADEGITVTVNNETGELAMDASVLFGGDSAVLLDEGKAFLNKFVKAYTSIVFSEKYEGFVEKTMVEGHTAPVGGTIEEGMPLSLERATNVKDYCISSETGVDTSKLAAALEAVGYSCKYPVYDDESEVDMSASRRVSFKFVINIGQ